MACRQHLVLPLALGWVYGVRSIFGLCLDHSGVNSASNNLPLSIFIGAAGWFTTEPAAPRSEGTETSFGGFLQSRSTREFWCSGQSCRLSRPLLCCFRGRSLCTCSNSCTDFPHLEGWMAPRISVSLPQAEEKAILNCRYPRMRL